MKVIGWAGPSGVGKTTLIEGVIAALRAHGLRVSVIKHAHSGFDLDHPGKDSWRHRQAGAFEVVVASPERLAILREFERRTEWSVHALIGAVDPAADWVLVEGFRDSDLLKVEVWREALGRPPRYPEDPFVVAVATDTPERLPAPTGLPVLDLGNPVAVATWLLAQGPRFDHRPEVHDRSWAVSEAVCHPTSHEPRP